MKHNKTRIKPKHFREYTQNSYDSIELAPWMLPLVKSVRTWSFSDPNTGKYKSEKLRIRAFFTQYTLMLFFEY